MTTEWRDASDPALPGVWRAAGAHGNGLSTLDASRLTDEQAESSTSA